MLRRLAINLYLLSQDPPRPVAAEQLDAFFAAMPPWVRTTFDSFPADEARRRLTLVYRLVFPYPEEFQAAEAGSPSRTGARKARPAKVPHAAPPPPAPARQEPPTKRLRQA